MEYTYYVFFSLRALIQIYCYQWDISYMVIFDAATCAFKSYEDWTSVGIEVAEEEVGVLTKIQLAWFDFSQ